MDTEDKSPPIAQWNKKNLVKNIFSQYSQHGRYRELRRGLREAAIFRKLRELQKRVYKIASLNLFSFANRCFLDYD